MKASFARGSFWEDVFTWYQFVFVLWLLRTNINVNKQIWNIKKDCRTEMYVVVGSNILITVGNWHFELTQTLELFSSSEWLTQSINIFIFPYRGNFLWTYKRKDRETIFTILLLLNNSFLIVHGWFYKKCFIPLYIFQTSQMLYSI